MNLEFKSSGGPASAALVRGVELEEVEFDKSFWYNHKIIKI